MTESDRVHEVVREWVAKAENDLLACTILLKSGSKSPTEIVCFHAQQCVEKYLKAYLVQQGTDFPKTHDIRFLCGLALAADWLDLSLEEQITLTTYATGVRYPGLIDLSQSEARLAVRIARRVRSAIRKRLGKRILF